MFRRIHSHLQTRTRAQAMVEFALALPIILAIVIGVFETGRLIFYVSAVNSASREAARFGSATGINPSSGLPYYRDCTNIVAKAVNMSFGSGITASNVVVVYDRGPGTSSYAACPTPPTTNQIKTGDRIVVSVCTNFEPIVTIPFMNLNNFVCSSAVTSSPYFSSGIVSTASRTILAKVDVSGATYTPVGGGGGGGGSATTVSPSGTTAVTTTVAATTTVATTAPATVEATLPVCLVVKPSGTSTSSGKLVFNKIGNDSKSLSTINISVSASYTGALSQSDYGVKKVYAGTNTLSVGSTTDVTVEIKDKTLTPLSGYTLTVEASGTGCATASYSFYY